ncbi:MAG: hypothetical protein QM679_04220 [Patulibacter sp.]
MARPLSIAIKQHREVGRWLIEALLRDGHDVWDFRETAGRPAPDLFLMDHDYAVPVDQPALIDYFAQRGTKTMLYGHGGGPIFAYDGFASPYSGVHGVLSVDVGNVELNRRLGDERPYTVVGWPFCEQRPFRPAERIDHVLFAPTHSLGEYMPAEMRATNARIFNELLAGPWQLTVRHLESLHANGLRYVEGVRYVESSGGLATDEIDEADVVVAGRGTLPTLAVARGVPVVFYDQCKPPLSGGVANEVPVPLRRPQLYEDYIRYPYDVEDGPLEQTIRAAAQAEATTWRRRFVGAQADPRRALGAIEEVLGLRPVTREDLSSARRFVTVALLDELRAAPEILAAYAQTFSDADDATLAVWAPGLRSDLTLTLAGECAAEAGLDPRTLPDILLMTDGHIAAMHAMLARRAQALLSSWPASGALAQLPAFDADRIGALHRLAQNAPAQYARAV